MNRILDQLMVILKYMKIESSKTAWSRGIQSQDNRRKPALIQGNL